MGTLRSVCLLLELSLSLVRLSLAQLSLASAVVPAVAAAIVAVVRARRVVVRRRRVPRRPSATPKSRRVVRHRQSAIEQENRDHSTKNSRQNMLAPIRESRDDTLGRAKVCCGGRAVSGPESTGVIGTAGLIIVPGLCTCLVPSGFVAESPSRASPAVLYYALVMPELFNQHLYVYGAIPCFTIPLSLSLLVLASCRFVCVCVCATHVHAPPHNAAVRSDPGIIPRQRKSVPKSIFNDTAAVKSVKVRTVGGVEAEVTLKYCNTCNQYRPDRASHCRCVLSRRSAPQTSLIACRRLRAARAITAFSTLTTTARGFQTFVGVALRVDSLASCLRRQLQCVGRNNYRQFIWFVGSVCFNGVWMLVAALVTLVTSTAALGSSGFPAFGFAIASRPAALVTALVLILYTFCGALLSHCVCPDLPSQCSGALPVSAATISCWRRATKRRTNGSASSCALAGPSRLTGAAQMYGRYTRGQANPRDRGALGNLVSAYCAPRWPDFGARLSKWWRFFKQNLLQTAVRAATGDGAALVDV